MNQVEIISNTEIAPGVFELAFTRSFDFLPGQVVSLTIDDHAPRMYSISSGNKEALVKLLYDVKPEGIVTPLISKLKKGSRVKVSEPFGKFTDNEKPAWWIASGTGIAPFHSMFLSGLGVGKVLVHGGRTVDSFYYHEVFASFFQKQYIRCISQGFAEGHYRGRLTSFLREQNLLPLDQNYYLCGSSEMVVEVRDLLIGRGIPYKNIFAEIYF